MMTITHSDTLTEMAIANSLEEFLGLSKQSQLVWVAELSPDDLETLRDEYFAWSECEGDGPLCMDVLAAILRKCEGEEEYDEVWQDSEVRLALDPSALLKLRIDTYENQVRPLLHQPETAQRQFVLSLIPADRLGMLKLLDRYAREYGRSARCRALEDLIRSI